MTGSYELAYNVKMTALMLLAFYNESPQAIPRLYKLCCYTKKANQEGTSFELKFMDIDIGEALDISTIDIPDRFKSIVLSALVPPSMESGEFQLRNPVVRTAETCSAPLLSAPWLQRCWSKTANTTKKQDDSIEDKCGPGYGFSFVGTQVPVEVDGEEFFIDILFYHLKLRCFVVCEIKAKKFKPADTGQLSFYLTAVDEQLKHKSDNPSIGILLCAV